MTREEFVKAEADRLARGEMRDDYIEKQVSQKVPFSKIATALGESELSVREAYEALLQDEVADIDPYRPEQRHRSDVERALREKQPVPDAVLADYPDLKPPASVAPAEPEALPDVAASTVKPKRPPSKVDAFAAPAPELAPPTPAPKVKPIAKGEVLKDIRDTLGKLPMRVGRFRGRTAGIYKRHPEVIRTKQALDLPTTIHELGHHINKLLWGLSASGELNAEPLKAHRNELVALDYDQKKRRIAEGFAEFVRFYVTDPSKAEQQAPEFHTFFDGEIAKHPQLKEMLLATRGNIERWASQPEQARVHGMISRGGGEKRPWYYWRSPSEFYADWVEDLYPVGKAVRDMAKTSGPLPTEQDAYKLMRLLAGFWGQADEFVSVSTWDFRTLQDTGPSLKAIYEPVKGKLDEVSDYRVAQRALEYIERGKEPGISKHDARVTVEELGKDPKVRKAAEELRDFHDRVLQFMVDARFISEEQKNKMRELNRMYVPFHRIFEAEEKGGAPAGTKRVADIPEPIKKVKGSTRQIQDPVETDIKNTFLLLNVALRNHAMRQFVQQAEKTGGSGRWIDEVPVDVKPTTLQLEEISKTLREAGANLDKIDLETVATVFRPQTWSPSGDHIVSVMDNGKRRFYQIMEPELYQALMGADAATGPLLAKVLSSPAGKLLTGPASLLRLTATGLSPEFIVRNLGRDAGTAFAQTQAGFVPGLDSIRGLAKVLNRDKLYHEWRRSGGEHAAIVSLDRKNLQKKVDDLVANPLKYHAKHPIEALRAFAEMSEAATRLGEFRKARAKGMTPRGASFAAREVTLDFARTGRITRLLNMGIPFFNAAIQGTDKFARTHRDNPKRALAVGAGLALFSLLVFLLNKDDEEYHEQPQYLKDFTWLIPTRGTPLQDKTPFVPIPKPFAWGIVYGTIPERFLVSAYEKDPKPFKDLDRTVGDVFSPAVLPTTFRLVLELVADKNLFTGAPITPEYLKRVRPKHLQAKPSTTAFSRTMARWLDGLGVEVSPLQIDHSIFGLTAGAGMAVARGAGLLSKDKPSPTLSDIPLLRAFAVRSPNPQAQSIRRFYDRIEELRGKRTAVRQEKRYQRSAVKGAERLTVAETYELKRLESAAKTLQQLHQDVRKAYSLTTSPESKRERLDQITWRMINTARRGLRLPMIHPRTKGQLPPVAPVQ
jgi:hypothetical protein